MNFPIAVVIAVAEWPSFLAFSDTLLHLNSRLGARLFFNLLSKSLFCYRDPRQPIVASQFSIGPPISEVGALFSAPQPDFVVGKALSKH